MTRRTLPLVLTAALLLAVAGAAHAHPANVAYADIAISERAVEMRLSTNLFELDLVLGLDADLDAQVTAAEVAARRNLIEQYLRKVVTVTATGAPLPLELQALEVGRGSDGKAQLDATLRFGSERPIGSVTIACRLLTEAGRDHTTLARIVRDGRTEEFVFRHDAVYEGGAGTWATALQFVRLGVTHIAIGFDHIAFLIGLLLAGGSLLEVLAIVTAFTIAHSITLGLAALDVVRLPAVLVEAAIALSIVWVAVENLLARHALRRWLVGFVFGLVHGFGFAEVLRELGLPTRGLVTSLLAFNIGVELGQVAIVLAVVPLLALLRTTRVYDLATRAASFVILSLGLYWLYDRLA